MQSYIVIHTQKGERDQALKNFIDKYKISQFDQTVITGEKSIGIEEIRLLQQKLLYKPLKGEKKAIILEDAQTLTIEAQNAMLKILEEPPLDTIFFLSSTTDTFFLPTILSRCTLVRLQEKEQKLSEEEIQNYQQFLTTLQSGNITGKLVLAEQLANDKENVQEKLAKLIIFIHEQMLQNLENHAQIYAQILSHLQTCYEVLTTTNTNPRLTLEHYFLQIS